MRKKLIIDQDALKVAKKGTLKDILWFAWYTLRDNSPPKDHIWQLRVAREIIESAGAYGKLGTDLKALKTSTYILILDDLRTRNKMPWIEYDLYQRQLYSMLEVLRLIRIIEINPLEYWVLMNEAKNLYKWK